jgi:hypothetical protein
MAFWAGWRSWSERWGVDAKWEMEVEGKEARCKEQTGQALYSSNIPHGHFLQANSGTSKFIVLSHPSDTNMPYCDFCLLDRDGSLLPKL